MMYKILLLLIIAKFFIPSVMAQQENADIRRGNNEFKAEDFQQAELEYREALEKNPDNSKALYNLASSLYKQGRYDEAANILEGLAQMPVSDQKKADIMHNLGNAQVNNQKIQEGVEAYKNALRLRPDDMDTRYNLAQALRMLEQQQQEQQQQQQDQDKEDSDDQDEQEQQPDEQQQPEDQEEQQQPRPDQISPEDAERILDALNQQEKAIQEKIEREQKQRQPVKPERQW